MDTHNESRMATQETLSQLAGRKMVVGAKQLRKSLQSGRASRVYLAQNADPAITDPIMTLCKKAKVQFLWVDTMEALGSACGIDVGAAAAAAVDE